MGSKPGCNVHWIVIHKRNKCQKECFLFLHVEVFFSANLDEFCSLCFLLKPLKVFRIALSFPKICIKMVPTPKFYNFYFKSDFDNLFL